MISLASIAIYTFSVVSVTLGIASCPAGYTNAFGDKCYKMAQETFTWDDARAFCQRDGGDLVSIHSQEENDVIQATLQDCCAFWIGLRCDAYYRPEWSDGSPVDYNNGDQDCLPTQATFFRQYDGAWIRDRANDDSVYVICQLGGNASSASTTSTASTTTSRTIKITTTSAVPLSGGDPECGLGYELLDDHSRTCVRIGTELTTWQEAEAQCQSEGAHLASIHSDQENTYIRRLALANRLTNAIFIGIKFDPTINAVSWADGSDFDFDNFDAGMPLAFFGECGAMQTGNLGGEWTSVFCDDSNKLPFACSKPQPCPAVNTFAGSGDVCCFEELKGGLKISPGRLN